MTTNPKPTYTAIPLYHWNGCRNVKVEGRAQIIEHRGNESDWVFTLRKCANVFEQLLKRGIPLEDAKILCYQVEAIQKD